MLPIVLHLWMTPCGAQPECPMKPLYFEYVDECLESGVAIQKKWREKLGRFVRIECAERKPRRPGRFRI